MRVRPRPSSERPRDRRSTMESVYEMRRWMAVGLFIAVPAVGMAQEAEGTDATPRWRGQADLGASFFFGNTEQTLVTTRTAAAYRTERLEVANEASFTYGEVTTQERDEQVNRRSWLVKLGASFHPMEHVSPFATGAIESSLEKRIDLRYAVGLGANFNVLARPETKVDFSVSALSERTVASLTQSADTTGRRTTLLRGSARFRAEHAINDHVRFTSETTYQPALRELDRFTVQSLTSLGYQMHRLLALTVSLRDSYDSDARTRGARENNEGEVVLGLQTKF